MKLEQIQMFLDIVHTGSINQTAKQGYISQQGLSMAVKQIESELDVSLFKRSNKGVALTTEGEVFYYYAERMLMLYKDMLTELDYDSENLVYDFYLSTGIYEIFGYLNDAPFAKKNGIFFSYMTSNSNDEVVRAINNRQGIAILCKYSNENSNFETTLRKDIRLYDIGTVNKLLYVCHKNMLPPFIVPQNEDNILEGKMCIISSNVHGLNIEPHKVRNAICVPDLSRRKRLLRERNTFTIVTYSMYRMYFDPTEYVILEEKENRVGHYYAAFHLQKSDRNMRIEETAVKFMREILSEDNAPILNSHYKIVL